MNSIRTFFLVVCLLLSALSVSGCNPLRRIHKEIKRAGYLPFVTPLEFAGTGTLVGGRKPKDLALVAPPERCFPRRVDNQPTQLRFTDSTVLPYREYQAEFKGNVKFDVFKLLEGGNGPIYAAAEFDSIKTVKLRMTDITVEAMDLVALADFYHRHMSEGCLDFLEHVPFIVQAIRVGKLSFELIAQNGSKVDFSIQVPEVFLDIGAGVEWEVRNKTTLEITTPKYMGFQLGRLQLKDKGFALMRANRLKLGKFHFETIATFDEDRRRRQPHSSRSLTELIRKGDLPSAFTHSW